MYTTTFTDINKKLSLLLDDMDAEQYAWSLALRIESWNWAQRHFVHHTPRRRVADVVVDNDGRSTVLPHDFLFAEGLWDAGNERWWYPIESGRPGAKEYGSLDILEFWVWGERLFLEKSLQPGYSDLKLYYFAYWPDVEYEEAEDGTIYFTQQDVLVPKWAELPLCHLTIASCMVPGEIFASDLNQYKMRIEAGNPLQNPREKSAAWHYQTYLDLISEFPEVKRSVRHT